ncbi:hypothetical protein HXX76_003840 [Chlamydomonas incerta]|uniref:Uncharacterized protein n=1 Tax=Chlamydomonas incerta TaxID=51695 RepID=A0A835TC76_CHLIN|nr:hypothetical protein HXX76_003840 [Chlamydomonas incerta]|eukprot:KAG2440987.1 hypothetical protein HXX76_003840 [Chlamydomonas incerta]
MATGQVLFQRFFCRKSMRDFNVRRMACACLFLATKLEESHRRTRDVLMVFDRINKRRDGSRSLPLLIPETKEYDIMKERVITYERILLKTFGFIIHCVHPHKFVNSFVHSLEGSDELQQLAWNMLNDSLRTTLCVRFKGHVVAAGAIYLAARRLQVPLPSSPAWWEAFKVPTDQMVEVVLALDALYQRPKASYIEVNPEVLKQHQALSGLGNKQLTPGPEVGNDSPAVAQDSSVIRGGPDLASQQQGPPPVAGTTAAPPGNAAEMLAAAVAAAQQRLQGSAPASGINAAQAAAVAAAAQAAQAAAAAAAKPDPDTVSTLHQGGNGNGPTLTGGQANGGGQATSAVEGGAVQSRKRSRSRERSQERSRRHSRSRSRSRSRDRHRNGSRRDHRSRSRERDRDRERRDHRDHHRDRDREREKEKERRDGGRDRGRDRERGRDERHDRDGADRGDLPQPPPLPPRPDRRR